MASPSVAALGVLAFGTARAELPEIGPLRKQLPRWAPEGTPGHFLKHADEQTVVAVAAVDQAIQSGGLAPEALRNWATIAAPRFIGRLAGVGTLSRFSQGGGPAISPHLIPQHSLHSVSGALSILLGSRQPNLGVGGSAASVTDSLLAALTLPDSGGTAGVWVVCTAWDPEPIADHDGRCVNQPTCHAVALALDASAAGNCCGRLALGLLPSGHPGATQPNYEPAASVAELGAAIGRLVNQGAACRFNWPLAWGATLSLELAPRAARLSAAA